MQNETAMFKEIHIQSPHGCSETKAVRGGDVGRGLALSDRPEVGIE